MIVFVTGGSGSGKSALAERVCTALGGERVYIATMPVYTEEDRQKVARHHALRAGRGFQTLEMPGRLTPVPAHATVLLECLSTFTANRMFSGERQADWAAALQAELIPLLDRPGHTVIVSADVSGEAATLDPETEHYRAVLTALGRWLASRSDAAVECVCGIPLLLKGTLPC